MEYFLVDKLRRSLEALKKRMNRSEAAVEEIWYKPDVMRYSELGTEGFIHFDGNAKWEGADKYGAFSFEIAVTPEMAGETVELFVTTGREGLWDATNPQFSCYINGSIRQAFDTNHTHMILTGAAKAGERFHIDLIGWMGNNGREITLTARYSVRDNAVYRLYHDLRVPYEVVCYLPKDSSERQEIEEYLDRAVNRIDFREGSGDFAASVAEADRYLVDEFYGKYCGKQQSPVVKAVGHTHIDVAWLWTLAQTRQKAVRSFSTVLELMRLYPEYIFMSSQPQLYQFVKEEEPALFEEMRSRVKEGRFEAEGGMWLEADCNLSSGESLIRQIVFGKRFFKEEFGVDNRILWLPDVFGYSAALPQILKKAGIDYFMTTKISWNEMNVLPADTFVWEGVDGTGVLTHFVTTCKYPLPEGGRTTYNGDLSPAQIRGTWERYQQKRINDKVLTLFGFGDGGGGTTAEMAENVTRLEAGIPGCPRVEMTTARKYFDELSKTVEGNPRLPKWCGELYLEYHRGTYTSMSRNKKYNRKSEFAYQNAEFLSVLAGKRCGLPYPAEKLRSGWQTILLNQFHDIIPGSSIKEVYDQSRLQYEEILKRAYEMQGAAMGAVAKSMNLKEDSVVVFNPVSFERSDAVSLDGVSGGVYVDGKRLPSQTTHDGKLIFTAESVPSKGYKAFAVRADAQRDTSKTATVSGRTLSTAYYDLTIDESGNLSSLYDRKNGRQVMNAGTHSALQVFEDMPRKYDNWELSSYYEEKMWEIKDAVSMELIENGPVRAVYRIEKNYLSSAVRTDLILYSNSPRIDFQMYIDWKEKDAFVKFAFPTNIFSTKASYEIQYGNVERPTHRNTSWDQARFEVCAQKWADLSEDGYGVSILNDCKYGHDIYDGVIRLSLLKSTCYPNPECDKEPQDFVFSLLPHRGSWREAGTVKEAYFLNCPFDATFEKAHGGALAAQFSLFSCGDDGIATEVIKQAEDGDGVIVRLYEYKGGNRNAACAVGWDAKEAFSCDLLENNEEALPLENGKLTLSFKPYEIKTLRIK